MKPFSDVVNSLLSVTDRLSQDYEALVSILTKNFGMPFLEGLDALLKDINGMLSGSFLKSFEDIFNNLILKNPFLGNVGGGGNNASIAGGLIGSLNPIGALTSLLSNLFGGNGNTNPAGNAVGGTPPPTSQSPTSNDTQKQFPISNVTLNLTNNVSGTGADGKSVGLNIGNQLYNLFQGSK